MLEFVSFSAIYGHIPLDAASFLSYLTIWINILVQLSTAGMHFRKTLKILKNANKDKFVSAFIENSPKQNYIVEYSSPNIAKPFHVGHLRSTLLGRLVEVSSLTRFYNFAFRFLVNLLKSAGHDVISVNYIGDWGTQFGMIASGLRKIGKSSTAFSLADYANAYVTANHDSLSDSEIMEFARHFVTALESGESEETALWRSICTASMAELKQTYSNLNVHFDIWQRESQFFQNAKELIHTLTKNGLVTMNREGLRGIVSRDHFIPLCKSDNTTLYLTRDLAAAIFRFQQYHPDCIYYVVDSGQHQHFENLKLVLSSAGYPSFAERIQHVKFGRILNTSTRQGKGVKADELLKQGQLKAKTILENASTTKVLPFEYESVCQQLVLTALIVNDFKLRRIIDYKFCWDSVLNVKGATGYSLQATHARLSSLVDDGQNGPLDVDCDLQSLRESEAKCLAEILAPEFLAQSLRRCLDEFEPYPLLMWHTSGFTLPTLPPTMSVYRNVINYIRSSRYCCSIYSASLSQVHFSLNIQQPPIRLKHEFVAPEWDLTSKTNGISIEEWQYYDNVIWPPHCESKVGEVFHYRENVKYSAKKMWYVCQMIQGLRIDDALIQLDYTPRKGATIMKEILLEAQQKASNEHCIEQKANLWIAEAFARNSLIVKGVRRHALERWGIVKYRYCNVFVRLQEGDPPQQVTRFPKKLCGWKTVEKYMEGIRNRKIMYNP
ncbi:putative arginine--tRNA ligase, mitochondrial [Trichinella pseudospiralis]|uniref:Probable arginine--tRNA ligase, mitochondrial n=1 Tax=Trichinella pseudospiralis TaxID=6337 RepID=A0A0V1JZ42_TRIPS|nr:putative arginine--tRNA ligase, mitochondrial [Trichinella pseudospiralis]